MWRRHHARVCSIKIEESRRMHVVSHGHSSQERQIIPHPPTPEDRPKFNHITIAIYHQNNYMYKLLYKAGKPSVSIPFRSHL